MTSPLDLAVRLMSRASTSGQEGAALRELDAILGELGWQVTRIPVAGGDRYSFLGRVIIAVDVTL